MGINIAQQTTMFLYSLLLGGVIGVVYDVFRVSRVALRLSWVMVLLEDILFFTLSTLLLWRYFLEQSSGEVRLFAVMGVLLGWLMYFLTLGSLVIRLSGFIIETLTRAVKMVLAPMKKIYAFIKKHFNKLIKLIILVKNRLKSRVYMLYNKNKRPRKKAHRKRKGEER